MHTRSRERNMKKCCTILLQRNLPSATHSFVEKLLKHNGDVTDFYIVESGSDDDKVSKYKDSTFHANWKEAKEMGLRTGRGFNYGLLELKRLNLDYEYIILATGDTNLPEEPFVKILIEELEKNKKIGILSPISYKWGGKVSAFNLKEITLSNYFPVPHVCWIFRRDCIEDIARENNDFSITGYLYDGTNFRAYGCDAELMIKAFRNDWCFAITSKTSIDEETDLTDKNHKEMKTEPEKVHKTLMYEEGLRWFKRKYNFDNKQQMWNLIRESYEGFFNRNPDLRGLMQ
jgi:hypothetical protein